MSLSLTVKVEMLVLPDALMKPRSPEKEVVGLSGTGAAPLEIIAIERWS